MNEKLASLLAEVGKNDKLREELSGAKDLEDVYAVVTKYVDGYTIDELKEGLKQIKAALDNANQEGELSDSDLEAVAGGSKAGVAKAAKATTWGECGAALKDAFTLGL